MGRRPSSRRSGGSTRSWAWTPALPNLGWVALFFAVPIALMFVYSLARQDSLTAQIQYAWTLDNYRALWSGLIGHALLRSLAMSATATLLCVLLGYPVAYYLARYAGRWKGLLLVLVIVPFWTSFVVRTYAWLQILAPEGNLNRLLRWAHLTDQPLSIAYGPYAIIIGVAYNYLPLMIFPLYVSLSQIREEVLEAARDLGAGSLSTFRRVTLPQARPGLIAGIIIVGVPATGEYVVPSILGGGKTLMFGNLIALQFGSGFRWPFGAALAALLTVILMVAVFLLLSRYGEDEQPDTRTGMGIV